MKQAIIFLVISVFLTNCATNNLTIRVTEPAPVSVSSSVKTIGVVNRTDTKQKKLSDKIADITKLGLLKADSLAALKAVDGLYEGLRNAERFEQTLKLGRLYLKNDLHAAFSPPLKQEQVQDICRRNKLDALFVLEYLDTDTRVTYDGVMVKRKIAGVEVEVPETKATADTRMRLGWRIYDADGKHIYDQYDAAKNVRSFGQGVNPMKAINAVAGHLAVIQTAAYDMGKAYSNDLLPYSHRVSRIYYVKGTDNFKVGKRLARAGKWDDAADYWEKETDNPKSKIAGRAYYNMAIINEINGDLDAAVDWAEKSYTLYNNKKALNYLRILRNRIARAEELKRQTE